MKTFNYIFLCMATLIFLSACRKLIEVPTPANQLTVDKVFIDSASATAAIGNAYTIIQKSIDPTLARYLGIYTDELLISNHSSMDDEFQNGRLTPGNGIISTIWTNLYKVVYQCNDIIEQAGNSTGLSAPFRKQLTNEAKFLRGYAYLSLVNCFGAVPLVTTTDVNVNAGMGQADSATLYLQIISDLNDAVNNLPPAYPSAGRVRANKWSAMALLARVFLYQQNWKSAENAATSIINTGIYGPPPGLDQVFPAGSPETILQCWTPFGYTNIAPFLLPAGGVPICPLSGELYNCFESGDNRKSVWANTTTVVSGTGSHTYNYAQKYHNRSSNTSSPEYLMILRLAEQYLIRAEARTMQNDLTGAQQDINIIRVRAGLADTNASTQSELLIAIQKERRVELFTEWGHRFFDLKRMGQLNLVFGASKPGWSAASRLFPIPQNELNADPRLRQNPGY